jgi:ribosomal protein L19E
VREIEAGQSKDKDRAEDEKEGRHRGRGKDRGKDVEVPGIYSGNMDK